MNKNGNLVISLDFEKMWGIHDFDNWKDKQEYIKKVDYIVPQILKLFQEYDVAASWAVVGLLFFDRVDELLKFSANIEKPMYVNPKLSSYSYFDELTDNDKLHSATDLIDKILKTPRQEIASHTFSHYYCKEAGQTPSQFKSDLNAGVKTAENNGIKINTLVFPRNQYTDEYLCVAKECGIKAFRGLEDSWIQKKIKNPKLKRLLLFISSYIPMYGGECYNIESIKKEQPYNVKASFFFRAATNNRVLEFMKMNRAKSLMRKAAKKKLICHIWFHPHNLSNNVEIGLKQVRNLCEYYKKLNEKYGLTSLTINDISREIGL